MCLCGKRMCLRACIGWVINIYIHGMQERPFPWVQLPHYCLDIQSIPLDIPSMYQMCTIHRPKPFLSQSILNLSWQPKCWGEFSESNGAWFVDIGPVVVELWAKHSPSARSDFVCCCGADSMNYANDCSTYIPHTRNTARTGLKALFVLLASFFSSGRGLAGTM